MTTASVFRVFVRVVFLVAFISFMSASIHHVATFFHNFEPAESDWLNSYMLAISIDLTSLILTIGVMFFRKQMPWYAQIIVWFFIVVLMVFSWLVNWEYATLYQSSAMKKDAFLTLINPILASSFAFLNLAYAIVSEFFNAKVITAEELKKEADRLEGVIEQQNRLAEINSGRKKVSLIQRAKETALEAREAASEVLRKEQGSLQQSVVGESEISLHQEMTSEATEIGDSESTLIDDTPVDVQETEEATPEMTPAVHLVRSDRTTDKLAKVSSPGDKKKPKESDTVKHIRRLVRKNINIQPSEIARLANVSRQYASRTKAQILKELSA